MNFDDGLYYLAKRRFIETGDLWHARIMKMCLFEPIRAGGL